MARPEPPRTLPGKQWNPTVVQNRKQRIAVSLLLLLVVLMAGCGGYASQANKYLTQGRSEVLGSAYTLERFGEGQVSGPFVRASLEQYAEAMKSTTQSIGSLKPPPGARKEHQRQVEAISRARSLVQGVAQNGVDPDRAPEVAHKLRGIAQELEA